MALLNIPVWKYDQELEVHMATYGSGIDQSQHTKSPGAPLTYSNNGGGGGEESEWFFWVWNFGQSDFFGSMEDAGIFLGHEKKNRGNFWVVKKELWDLFGYAKKSSDFFG